MLMQKKCKNDPPSFQAKLPKMMKQLELELYMSAGSFEEYANEKTMLTRMKSATHRITKRCVDSQSQASNNFVINGMSSLHL